MMISHNRKKNRFGMLGGGNRSFGLIAGSTVLAIFFIAVLLWRSAFASVFGRLSVPFFNTRNMAVSGVGSVRGQIMSNSDLLSQNVRLRTELASSSVSQLDRDLLYKENLYLKAQLGRSVLNERVLAAVVLGPPSIPYDTLLVDVGSAQGIERGDHVSAGGSTIIGTVSDVYATTARVVLLSAPGEEYDALIFIQSDTATADANRRISVPITIHGQGAGSLKAQVPAGVPVVVGDTVAFPGLATSFVASVVRVDRIPGESFQSIYLRLSVNPSGLRYVEIEKQSHAKK